MLPARACTFSFITTWFSSPEFLKISFYFTKISIDFTFKVPREIDNSYSSTFIVSQCFLFFGKVWVFFLNWNFHYVWIDWRKISSETHIIHEEGRKGDWIGLNIIWYLISLKFFRVGVYSKECETLGVELPQANLQLENNAQLATTPHLLAIGHTHNKRLILTLKTRHQPLHILFQASLVDIEPSDIEESRTLSTKCETLLVLHWDY